ncbi:TIGR03943 family putative permease subunit [Microbacterium immunditiarum]|uniref:Putative repeat protein (TIGR03943 family) n=1 Tax=Microbacterium immunditiarum TaxID=337480 RepID=A0A7Y9GL22_9MICO|nr:TIGR03943 family protein [Microbacterium immunditiarum]NYE18439.1 putative repeat protein (TIGR03943 family) [Microbacterium immunditiarum]
MSRSHALATRWLGVGLASVLAVVTLGLGLTGRLGLYINPESAWWAMGMAVVMLAGAIASFALPLGAEEEGHGHDHGHGHDELAAATETKRATHPAALVATVAGGVVASGVVVTGLVLPPATLSAELAMSRNVGAAPLFAGADAVTLAASGDTTTFGVGEWATVFATATNPETFDGDAVELTGFATPSEDGDFTLTRLVITHCVIDAQPAGLPVVTDAEVPATGQWVNVRGTVRAASDGLLVVDAASIEPIDEPGDPYEY